MKQNNKKEFQEKSIDELKAAISDIVKEIREKTIDIKRGKEKNVRFIKNKRQVLAVIKTILHDKQLEVKNG